MEPICKTCRHNCTDILGIRKDKQPAIKNKLKIICWCNTGSGRAITKKYSQCKFYEKAEKRF